MAIAYDGAVTSIPANRKSEFDTLIDESQLLEATMRSLQEDEETTDRAAHEVIEQYRKWHSSARRLLSPESQRKLDELRDGGTFLKGIQAYLLEPRTRSPFYTEPSQGVPQLGSPWLYPFTIVRERMEKARALLFDAAPSATPAELVATDLAQVLRRLPRLLETLNRQRPDWKLIERIADEHDLQAVVEALLRTLFDDVRPEDYVPSRAGRNSRVDFVLPEVGVVIETKMTRPGLDSKRLVEELLIDAGRYPKHPDCDAIVALVYDPERRVVNPAGLERDLTQRTQYGLSFFCVVVN
ncbi:hypothetical protein [Leifsonia sp. EB34]|uniref:PD-(D/E)XK nuclease domain-containing protein n=1 Tax=Leifsonia sp. EB34 TaxID=3156303 RepID=UPI003511E31B